MTLAEILAELERGELAGARVVFTNPEHEPWRERVVRAIEDRIARAHDDADYGFVDLVRNDAALPQELRTHASNQRWLLDHRPAGPEHRAFLRIHGVKSIDDIDD